VLFDTHSHIYLDAFEDDREQVVQSAKQQGLINIALPNIDLSTVGPLNELVAEHPDFCLPMMALHPTSVKGDFENALNNIGNELEKKSYIAVGETGIDLYWDTSTENMQREAFRTHIAWAKKFDLPLIIHARNSYKALFEELDKLWSPGLEGIFHCFTGTLAEMHHILEYQGFYFGLGGVITFKNSKMEEVVNQLPEDKIVLETDAPYLAPVPFRGKRNQPAYITYVAQKLAEMRGETLQMVHEYTSNNAKRVFKMNKHA
jgi:TatD DNase family protein